MEAPTMNPSFGYPRRYLWILLFVTGAVHVPALFHPFLLDDYVYLEQAKEFDWRKGTQLFCSATLDQSASGVWWVPSGVLPFYRPIGQLGIAADYAICGLRPFGYHLANLLLHMACTLLVWHLARRLFDAPAHAQVAATVFAFHPLHTEAVTWISGRFDLLVCVWVLLSVLAYLQWRDGSAGRWVWGVFCVLAFAVALGCKETALVLPAALLVVELRRDSHHTRRTGEILPLMAVLGMISVLYLWGRVVLFGGPLGKLPPPYGLDLTSPAAVFKCIAWSLGQYLLGAVLCIPIEPAYIPQFWRQHLALFGVLVAMSTALTGIATIIGRSRVFFVGVAWLALFASPALLSMPGQRNVYLASVGLALCIAAVFRALDRQWATPGRTNPSFAPPVSPWLRRASRALVGVWVVLCLSQQLLMGRVAGAGEKVYSDLQSMLPDPPRNARIFVVHQSPINSVGFSQALRLRYDRPDLSGCALSLSPTLEASSIDTAIALGPDSVRLVRKNGVFLASFVEQFHRFGESASTLAMAGRRAGLDLRNAPLTYDHLTTLEFRLPHPLGDPRIELFYWDNHQVRQRLDLLRIGSLAGLKRCSLLKPSDAQFRETDGSAQDSPLRPAG